MNAIPIIYRYLREVVKITLNEHSKIVNINDINDIIDHKLTAPELKRGYLTWPTELDKEYRNLFPFKKPFTLQFLGREFLDTKVDHKKRRLFLDKEYLAKLLDYGILKPNELLHITKPSSDLIVINKACDYNQTLLPTNLSQLSPNRFLTFPKNLNEKSLKSNLETELLIRILLDKYLFKNLEPVINDTDDLNLDSLLNDFDFNSMFNDIFNQYINKMVTELDRLKFDLKLSIKLMQDDLDKINEFIKNYSNIELKNFTLNIQGYLGNYTVFLPTGAIYVTCKGSHTKLKKMKLYLPEEHQTCSCRSKCDTQIVPTNDLPKLKSHRWRESLKIAKVLASDRDILDPTLLQQIFERVLCKQCFKDGLLKPDDLFLYFDTKNLRAEEIERLMKTRKSDFVPIGIEKVMELSELLLDLLKTNIDIFYRSAFDDRNKDDISQILKKNLFIDKTDIDYHLKSLKEHFTFKMDGWLSD